MRNSVQDRKVGVLHSKVEDLDALTFVLPPFIPRMGLLGWLEGTNKLFLIIYLPTDLSRTVLEKY